MERQEAERALDLLRAMIEINTVNPPGNEAALAELTARFVAGPSVKTELIPCGEGRASMVAKISGTGELPPLILCGHLDTVPYGDESAWTCPPGRMTRVGSRLYGRGTSDMKSGLAAILFAFSGFAACQAVPKGDMIVAATADEENAGGGARSLLERLPLREAAAVVIGEPTSNQIALASKGVVWAEFSLRGRTSHGAQPEGGVNAAEAAFSLLGRLKDACRGQAHPLLTPPTCTLTGISGGVKTNMVPDACRMTVDIRTTPAMSHPALLERIDRCCRETEAELPGLAIQWRTSNNRPAVETDRENAVVRSLSAIRERVCGEPTRFLGTGYFSDASVFAEAGETPCLLFGPGIAANAHVPDEFVEAADYLDAVECYRALLASYY